MRTHRLYLPELQPGDTAVTGREAHHLAAVLRVREGAAVRAFDGRGTEADGVVAAVEEMRVIVRLERPRASDVEAAWRVTVAPALLKGDKLADVVRQGTELGAVCFAPHVSAHADVKELSPNRLERWRRVAREAAKQSGRALVPEVREAQPLAGLEPGSLGLVAHPRASRSVREALEERRLARGDAVTIVTGPEGGLGDREIEALEARGFVAVRLGARVLRAETAPVALLAALLVPEDL